MVERLLLWTIRENRSGKPLSKRLIEVGDQVVN